MDLDICTVERHGKMIMNCDANEFDEGGPLRPPFLGSVDSSGAWIAHV
jgi:hypothetical protein